MWYDEYGWSLWWCIEFKLESIARRKERIHELGIVSFRDGDGTEDVCAWGDGHIHAYDNMNSL